MELCTFVMNLDVHNTKFKAWDLCHYDYMALAYLVVLQ
jgi:hypothetical protein